MEWNIDGKMQNAINMSSVECPSYSGRVNVNINGDVSVSVV